MSDEIKIVTGMVTGIKSQRSLTVTVRTAEGDVEVSVPPVALEMLPEPEAFFMNMVGQDHAFQVMPFNGHLVMNVQPYGSARRSCVHGLLTFVRQDDDRVIVTVMTDTANEEVSIPLCVMADPVIHFTRLIGRKMGFHVLPEKIDGYYVIDTDPNSEWRSL